MLRSLPVVLAALLFSLSSFAATRVPGAERLLTTPRPAPAGGDPFVTSAAANGRDFAVAWHNRDSYYVTRLAPLAPRVESTPMRLDVVGAPRLAAVGTDYVVVWIEDGAVFSGRLAETGAIVSRSNLGPAEARDGITDVIANDTHALVAVRNSGSDSTRMRLLDSHGAPAAGWIDLGPTLAPAFAADPNGFLVIRPDSFHSVVLRRLTMQGLAGELRIDAAPDVIDNRAAAFDGTDYLVVLGTRAVLVSPSLTARSELFPVAPEHLRLRTVIGRDGGSLLFYDGAFVRVDHATRTASAPSPSLVDGMFVTDGRSLLGLSTFYDPNTSPRIFGRWLRLTNAAPLSESILLSIGTPEQRRPAVALGDEVDLVVWQEDNSILATRLLPDGTVVDDPPLRLSAEGVTSVFPAVTFNGEHFVVVWCEPAGEKLGRIVALRVGADGVPIDSVPVVVHNAWGDTPAIAHTGDTTLITWVGYGTRTSTHGPGREVFGARMNRSGVLLDFVPLLISRDAWDHFHPDVAAGHGEFLVGWQTYRWFGHHSPIATASSVARVTAGGTVHEPVVLEPLQDNAHVSAPQVAWNGSEFLIAWEARGRAFAQRMNGTRTPIPLTSVADAAFINGLWHVVSGEIEQQHSSNPDIRAVALDAELRIQHLPEIASETAVSDPVVASNGTRAVLVYRRLIAEPPHNSSAKIVYRLYDTPAPPPPTRRRAARH
ncbi:MAG TPA: hypothetical protein VF883_17185 [Thermoanaerobaculia bacterium]|jgi:hypothetical protein